MKKTCTYGLEDADTIKACIDMANDMTDAERAKWLEAAKAIKLVRTLKEMSEEKPA